MIVADNKPTKDFSTRYETAKKWRDIVQPDLQEVYAYIAPGREDDFDRTSSSAQPNDDEDPDIFISLPEELATDFAADLVTYYTPKEAKWTEYEVTAPIPEEAVEAVMKLVSEREDAIHEMIQASNYNDLAPQIMFEANHGTAAMWVDPAHINGPFYVETVPSNELLITPGHMGILDRFREKKCAAHTLESLLSNYEGVSLADPRIKKKINTPGQVVDVCWGFWMDWKDKGNPVWRCEITVDQIRVTPSDPITLGPYAGSCPLLPGRFNPQVNRPWARGPARVKLRDMRVYNAISEAVIEGLDQALRNTLIYADDGLLDFSEGIVPGTANAAHRGFTRDQIYELNKHANLEPGFFSEERLEDRLRSGFYQDGPRQRGDTPPTASQWIDERRRVQQRIGKPSAPLWTELFLPFIQRVEYIGIQKGILEEQITHDGEALHIKPMSPLQKAQNQDKVQIARSNLDLAFQTFGENLNTFIDPVATFGNVLEMSGDEIVVMRDEEQMQEPPQGAPEGQV